MITVIGILVGAIIVALIWEFIYFDQEIHDVMAEMRARDGGYYTEFMAEKERGEWQRKYEKLEHEYKNLKIAFDFLAQVHDQEIEEPEDDDELDN